jgi:hypothetical protein
MKHVSGLLLLLISLNLSAQENDLYLDLSGEWKVGLDREDKGEAEKWYEIPLSESLSLPGSLAENGLGDAITPATEWTGQVVDSSWYHAAKYAPYREEGNIKIPFWLQPEKKYTGAAWFQKEVLIPESWDNKHVVLHLERPHWETSVWIDEREIGSQNFLATPHNYILTGKLDPGKHLISIRVDNRIKEVNPGINSHSIADHTQSNWNGLVGELSLKASPLIFIESIRLSPDVEKGQVRATLRLRNISGKAQGGSIRLQCREAGSGKDLKEMSQEIPLINDAESLSTELIYHMGSDPLLWDEFNPNLYLMELELTSAEGVDHRQVQFGMREFKSEGKRFAINGRPLFLRGTLECAIFPKTGYPPTSTGEWIKIMEAVKAHGLNHIRFHSWCPPEAAFDAADRMGVYLQVECSSWANSGASIGDGKPLDAWLYKEAESILESYGNHPSFCMMAYGNEPAGLRQEKYLRDFISHFRNQDPRRVYTGGAGWPYLKSADFFNAPRARIQGWGQGLESIINAHPPQSHFDFREIIDETPMPYVSHEIGQWCVYPNLKEVEKYDGVLKARNFEIFRESLEASGMASLADSFLLASGKLQALCYKADIEAALRTPEMAGFQLLDLHDFPGQGTALVGVLDPFWEEKGYISPDEYARFCNETVPLARLKKRVFSGSENLEALVEVAHFGKTELKDPQIEWKIGSEWGKVVAEGSFKKEVIRVDNAQELGIIQLQLSEIRYPVKLKLEVSVNQFSNSWDFWVYPEDHAEADLTGIHLSSQLDQASLEVLKRGGKVLWTLPEGSLSDESGGNIALGFSSIFWNTAWTRGQAPHTLGILCDPAHPALASFPTEYHSNWQWWDAMHHGQAIRLDGFEKQIHPIVRVIDDWFENRPLGLIFEARVGQGKIIVCGTDLLKGQADRLEARQLLYSLLDYMASDQFAPSSGVTPDELLRLVK